MEYKVINCPHCGKIISKDILSGDSPRKQTFGQSRNFDKLETRKFDKNFKLQLPRIESWIRMRSSLVWLLVLVLVASSVAPILSGKAQAFLDTSDDPATAGFYINFKMASSTQNASYSEGLFNVIFNVTVDNPQKVYVYTSYSLTATYQGDWMFTSKQFDYLDDLSGKSICSYNFEVTGIPFGKHTLNFTVTVLCDLYLFKPPFQIKKTVSVPFFMHSDPIINFLSTQNVTTKNPSFPLNFIIDHPVSEMSYCLDGQKNKPINGNTTLTDLSNERHNVTVSATDEFGYSGVSDNLFFNVNAAEPLPSMAVIVSGVFLIIVIIIASSLLFRRHQKTCNRTNFKK